MCGILGIVSGSGLKPDPMVGQSMLNYLSARGPDDRGIFAFSQGILGHTRLSIIDLSTGAQPMQDNKRNIAITFNGEIYNYRELRTRLGNLGHTFATRSDTEVILKAYIEYGVECPTHLDGMFAFAIWDEDRQSLFMARDRFGKKPLYHAFSKDGDLVFASEIKAILASGMIDSQIDYSAIQQYLQLLYVPPTTTAFVGIQTLKPAHWALFKEGSLSTERYWSLKWSPLKISYAAAKEELKGRLQEAVKKRLVADVEIGTMLSGGVDSTVVTHYAQVHSPRRIKSFSVGYGNYINELPFALEASQKIGTDHYTLQANGDLTTEFLKVIEYFDEPHADSSNVAQFLVSRLAQSKVKVVLSGDGGDELFLGYPWYLDHQGKRRRRIFLDKLLVNSFAAYLDRIQTFKLEDLRSIWPGQTRSVANEQYIQEIWGLPLHSYGKVNYFDLTVYLPGQLLTKADRAGMMNSLEVRSPFLDHALAEFVYNLPRQYKTDRKNGKIILKDILSETMPREFVDRPKQGFGAPVRQWLREESMKTLVQDLFFASKANVYDFLDAEAVRKLLDRFYVTGINAVNYRIWALLCLELWLISSKKLRSMGAKNGSSASVSI